MDDNNKKNNFTIIPNGMIKVSLSVLPAGERALLAYLMSCASNGYTTVDWPKCSTVLGVKSKTIQRWKIKLIKKGLVTETIRAGYNRASSKQIHWDKIQEMIAKSKGTDESPEGLESPHEDISVPDGTDEAQPGMDISVPPGPRKSPSKGLESPSRASNVHDQGLKCPPINTLSNTGVGSNTPSVSQYGTGVSEEDFTSVIQREDKEISENNIDPINKVENEPTCKKDPLIISEEIEEDPDQDINRAADISVPTTPDLPPLDIRALTLAGGHEEKIRALTAWYEQKCYGQNLTNSDRVFLAQIAKTPWKAGPGEPHPLWREIMLHYWSKEWHDVSKRLTILKNYASFSLYVVTNIIGSPGIQANEWPKAIASCWAQDFTTERTKSHIKKF